MNLEFLVGQEITSDEPILSATATMNRKTKYTIVKAYPHFVKGERFTENGDRLTRCFNLGDLITMGLISNRRIFHELQ